MRSISLFVMILLLGAAACQAGILTYTNPDAGYVGSTRVLPITAPEFDLVSTLFDDWVTVNISPPSMAMDVGGGWGTWSAPPYSELATPRVLNAATNDMWFTFSRPLLRFGFEAEPDTYGFFDITAEFYNGETLVGSITRTVDGYAGARLFAAQTADLLFTSVHVTTSDTAFASAQIRYTLGERGSGVPEPATWLLLLVGCAGLLLWRRRVLI